MKPKSGKGLRLATAPLWLAFLACCSPGKGDAGASAMPAFHSDRQLGELVDRYRARIRQLRPASMQEGADGAAGLPPMAAQAPAARADGQITNVQEQGVDEGGIVKVHGQHLVVLRRGRLFTVDTSAGQLRTVAVINAYPPGETLANGAWYDEMLVANGQVIVIGYSYARFGTEVNRFRIDSAGRLSFRDSHRIRSADYYSSRNYASRLIGDRLVFYQPLPIWLGEDWRDALPGIRRWQGPEGRDEGNQGFTRLAPAARIHAAKAMLEDAGALADTFHSVTSCDLAAPALACASTVVLGAVSHSFYVSNEAVYVWTSDGSHIGRRRHKPYLYRMPLDGTAPKAVGVRGGPTDQFSFQEDSRARTVNILVRNVSGGDSMWWPEFGDGGVALLRLRFDEFGDGTHEAPKLHYRQLPGEGHWLHNRFTRSHLLYAVGSYGDQGKQVLHVVPVDGGEVTDITLPHAVSRLDVMGGDGIAIGAGRSGALGFSSIGLDGGSGDARLEDTYFFAGASEGENRSQAFFYLPNTGDRSGQSGVLALPVSRRLSGPGAEFLGSSSAIVFLNRIRRKLSEGGELAADTARAVNDNCLASCVDWYGNARPIFLRGRVFALMGYELVEGTMRDGRIAELRRVNFAPGAS